MCPCRGCRSTEDAQTPTPGKYASIPLTSTSRTIFCVPGPPKEPKIMDQYPKTESIGSIWGPLFWPFWRSRLMSGSLHISSRLLTLKELQGSRFLPEPPFLVPFGSSVPQILTKTHNKPRKQTTNGVPGNFARCCRVSKGWGGRRMRAGMPERLSSMSHETSPSCWLSNLSCTWTPKVICTYMHIIYIYIYVYMHVYIYIYICV